ncbi:glycosyltransferase [Williamsia phyllosphaerae]|uniref:Glycosyl transferase family 28 C-terminal domain-containing protein n=1 Tax=Williamsia phyllosphaerae TaxID=885042 RepID=A0ABQ1UJV7_9NOCA|nr:glycosyltransferase [Williamsia phyllosphaerae]GGF20239.1 hypothetical protein GCM10007298_15260 [Williamsia phyllosphaerae]
MIGYYVHHHGVGHMTRADSISRALEEPVTVLSSRPRPAEHGSTDWIGLPMDTDPAPPVDPTAGSVVHWAPIGVVGLTDRMAAIAAWIERTSPRLVVVDVSVEVTVFIRLMGVPVVVMAMPGFRGDDVHSLAYRMASHIVAPWSRDVYDPDWLRPFADKTTYTGSISRFDGRDRDVCDEPPTVLVLGAAGGTSLTEEILAGWADPRYSTRAVGFGGAGWVDDVWPLLCSAEVVLTHAGQNAVADVAAAGVPAVIVPQQRPFGEQIATGHALATARIAAVTTTWPTADEWTPILDRASALGRDRWAALQTAGAATRAARAIAAAADASSSVAR